MARNWLFVLVVVFVGLIFVPRVLAAPPGITFISDNAASGIPKFEKFEASFTVSTTATNMQMPYDSNPPPGVNQNGISVDGVFTSPSGKTFKQPAFYYQVFDDQIKPNVFGTSKEWFYPTNQFLWKVRFAPDEVGTWQFYLIAQDASGTSQSSTRSFNVNNSNSHGFVRVSSKDPRYFEFSDGTYFPGLGYNMNYDHVDWVNPVLSNQTNFAKMKQNGIQLARIWLSQWAIFGSRWNPWFSIRGDYDGELPNAGLITNGASSTSQTPSSQLTLVYSESGGVQNKGDWFDACRFIGGFQAAPALKAGANYRVRVRYKASDITGPRNSAFPDYGLVAKVQNPNDGNWHTQCYNGGDPQNGVPLRLNGARAYGHDSANWTYLEADFINTQNLNFLPIFYLALENVNNTNPANGNHAYAHIDTVEIKENLGGGNFGPNVVTKPSMEHMTYFMERNAYAFDKVLDLAHQNDVYLKVVTLEKNDQIPSEIGADGNKANFDPNNFYGEWRNVTAVRWFQQAWWRYIQARWGYSPNIHSFETTNEADPSNGNHLAQADEMGKFLHCRVFDQTIGAGDSQKCTYNHPNRHLVTTSFWAGFPGTKFSDFWGDAGLYPNLDFANVHQYIPKDTDLAHFVDTALSTFDVSKFYGAKASTGALKPVLRGETGLISSANNTSGPTSDIYADTGGVWLHNLIWGQINPGGLIESYWYDTLHIYNSNPPSGAAFDHRNIFGTFYKFIKDIPLNNGNYVDLVATFSSPDLRVWGQKDLVNKRAHVWIANKNHTWKNVVDNTNIFPINDSVTISGFSPNTSYKVEWWDTYAGTITKSENLNSNSQGEIVLPVSNLTSDVAVKIGDYTNTTPIVGDGDSNKDGSVNALDLQTIIGSYIKTVTSLLNQYPDNKINAFDFVTVLKRLP